MKNRFFLLFGAFALFLGCQNDQFKESPMVDISGGFEVELESILPDAGPETKTYADEQHLVVWHNDDRVTVFEKKAYWEEYRYTGRTGTVGGRLLPVPSEGSGTGGDLDYYYAIYPHSELNGFDNNGHMLLTIPKEQPYDEFSFGRGTNLMVSASADNNFKFKNIGGYLVFKLYGEGVSVSSIRLTGNNGEEISGDIDVVISPGVEPTVTMSTARYAEKYDYVELVCDPPVALGATASDYKEFWFVLPPMTFTGGFSIEVTTSDGGVWTKTTVKSWTITRNHYTPVSAMKIDAELLVPAGSVFFEDANFKAYMVDNFDTDSDGEISYEEALLITSIDVSTNNISSVHGIEYCLNLQWLHCRGSVHYDSTLGYDVGDGLLSSLDVSNNTALTFLYCACNQLTSLDVSNNTALEFLNCWANQLTCLDVSNNTALTELSCSSNQLTSLDVSSNTALTGLSCDSNQLASLDVSNNTALEYLYCDSNQLTSLDVSDNTALTELYCSSNQLASLDVSNNTALEYLYCACNQLTSLDVSNNTALTRLNCYSNQLTSLDVSNNTALTSLDCSPMNDSQGQNLLGALYIAYGQSIPNVTVNRSNNNIPADTQIIVKPEAVDLGLSVKWASFNLGASAPEEYGDYYAWGETEPYYSSLDPLTWKEGKTGYNWGSYKWCMGSNDTLTKYCFDNTCGYNGFKDSKTVLDPKDDAASVALGGNWRMPTDADWTDLRAKCTWTWATQNDVNGMLVTGSNGNSIFLPAAGYRYYTNLSDAGSNGIYWSSSLDSYLPNGARPYHARRASFNSGGGGGGSNDSRCYGLSIRPVTE